MKTHCLLPSVLLVFILAMTSESYAQGNIVIEGDAVLHGNDALPVNNGLADSLFFFDRNNLNFFSGILKSGDISIPQVDSFGYGGSAFGQDVYPMGSFSFAQGAGNFSRGPVSSSFGLGNQNYSYGGTVLGILNDPLNTINPSVPYDTMPLLSVGNGDVVFGVRHNAFTVFYNGEVEINQAYTLPNTDGSNGQVLSTDGDGNISWEHDKGVFESTGGLVRSTGPLTDDFVFGSSSLPSAGAINDTLLFFDYGKSAFRAGRVYSDRWSPDSIGNYSFAVGLNSLARGTGSVSLGSANLVRGDYSAAFGFNNEIVDSRSFAAGSSNRIIGAYSASFGASNEIYGTRGMSWGWNNVVMGNDATAWGSSNSADTTGVTVWGRGVSASGIYATAWGRFSIALGQYSTAWGYRSDAVGEYSTAWGYLSEANGPSSTSWGHSTLADAEYSTAWGYLSTALGDKSTAWGDRTLADGENSTAWGDFSYAVGDHSTAFGNGAYARSYASVAFGQYNEGLSGNDTAWVVSDPLLEVGIGSSFDDRKNALTILKNGKTGIGTSTPDEALSVVGTIRGALEEAETNYIEMGHGGNNAFINANGVGNIDLRHGTQNIMTLTSTRKVGVKTNDPDSDLHIVHANSGSTGGLKLENTSSNDEARLYVSSSDGHLRIYTDDQAGAVGDFNDVSGVYSATSDRRLKEEFEELRFDWDSFMKLQALMYEYKADETDQKHIGMIAQDVMEIYPEVVTYNAEEDIYHMNYDAFGVIAIRAIQQQQDRIYRLENALEHNNTLISQRLARLEQSVAAHSTDD